MGLTAKWACVNVGAGSPEGYGYWFSWGEGAEYVTTKDTFWWESYKLGGGTNNSPKITKYNVQTEYGTVDNRTSLLSTDDVATVLDADSRMPTASEAQDLIDRCVWAFTTYKGVNGYLVKSNVNGARIFLPAAGYYSSSSSGSKSNDFLGSAAYYWTSDLYSEDCLYAKTLDYYGTYYHEVSKLYRSHGASVRPVSKY